MIHQNFYKQVLGEARTILGDWAPSSVSKSTETQYLKTVAMLKARNRRLADASCSQTYYRWRAAIVYVRKKLLWILAEGMKKILSFENLHIDETKVFNLACDIQDSIRKLFARPTKDGLVTLRGEGEFSKLKKHRCKQRPHLGKRKLLGLLPNNWPEMIWQLAKRSKYQNVVAVMALTGCRPSEIVKGVQCRVTEENLLELTIEGSKTGMFNQNGQAKRKLTFWIEGDEATHLASICADKPDQTFTVFLEKARLITDLMRKWSKKLWPGRPGNCVTPYAYRHAAFSRFKKQGDPIAVAQAMGQASDRTQQRYGTRNQAGQGAVAVTIWGSTPVRTHTNSQTKAPRGVEKAECNLGLISDDSDNSLDGP